MMALIVLIVMAASAIWILFAGRMTSRALTKLALWFDWSEALEVVEKEFNESGWYVVEFKKVGETKYIREQGGTWWKLGK